MLKITTKYIPLYKKCVYTNKNSLLHLIYTINYTQLINKDKILLFKSNIKVENNKIDNLTTKNISKCYTFQCFRYPAGMKSSLFCRPYNSYNIKIYLDNCPCNKIVEKYLLK